MISNKRQLRIFGLAAALTLPVLTLGAFTFAQEKGTMKPETSGHKYKNIKVLKDLPADQLIPVMHQFNDALGVKCDACHIIEADHKGFDKDDKPMKEAARKMILMVRDIKSKQKALGGKGTCFMCHHGSPEPQLAPPAQPVK